jgi:diketogulonate reductase-like aldo/keto reductase
VQPLHGLGTLTHDRFGHRIDQVEFHPRLQQPSLQRFLADNGMQLQAWAPLIFREKEA